MGIKGLVINEKQADLLIGVNKQGRLESLTNLAKLGGYNTFAQAFKVMNKFEEKGLVKFEKKGRIKMIELTEKGMEVCRLLVELRFLIR